MADKLNEGNPLYAASVDVIDGANAYEKGDFVGVGRSVLGIGVTALMTAITLKGAKTTRGPPKRGIYEFPDQSSSGVPYVGQSGNISRRLSQHIDAGRLAPGTEMTQEINGGKVAREVAEHQRIQELTGGVPAKQSPNVSNKVDPIGPNRRHLINQKNEACMKELPIPPAARTDSKSRELARVWAAHGEQHVSLDLAAWPDSASWGLLLADLANHISQAYAKTYGLDAKETLERIRDAFDAEMESPTTAALDDR